MIPDYKGYKIDVTADGRFIATDSEDEEQASDHSLALLKEKLDKISKKAVKTRVWIFTYDKLESGTLTSVKQEGGHSGSTFFYARVSYDHGSWGQVNPNTVFPMNSENDHLAQEYMALRKHIDELEKSGRAIREKMKSINIQEILK